MSKMNKFEKYGEIKYYKCLWNVEYFKEWIRISSGAEYSIHIFNISRLGETIIKLIKVYPKIT